MSYDSLASLLSLSDIGDLLMASKAPTRRSRAAAPISLVPSTDRCCRHSTTYCELPVAAAGRDFCELHALEAGGYASASMQLCVCSVAGCDVPAPRAARPPLCLLHRAQLGREQSPSRRSGTSSDVAAASAIAASSSGDSWSVARGLLQQADGFDEASDQDNSVHCHEHCDAGGISAPVSSGGGQSYYDDDEDDEWLMERPHALSASPADEPLRTASVLTDEEVVQQAAASLLRLRRHYVQQLAHVRRQLKQQRRKFLVELASATSSSPVAAVSTTDGSVAIRSQVPPVAMSLRQKCRQRAYNRYQRPAGRDHLLWYKRSVRRAQLESVNDGQTPAVGSRSYVCAHTDGSWLCGRRPLPLTRYCMQHVTSERQQQLLFTICAADGCRAVVARVPPLAAGRMWCRLHWPLPLRFPSVHVPATCVDPLRQLESSLDDQQRRLVADIANTLMASAGVLGTQHVTALETGGYQGSLAIATEAAQRQTQVIVAETETQSHTYAPVYISESIAIAERERCDNTQQL